MTHPLHRPRRQSPKLPYGLTRQQYRASALLAAGWEWDRWASEMAHVMPDWDQRIADRDAGMARILALYNAQPRWSPQDARDAAADVQRFRRAA